MSEIENIGPRAFTRTVIKRKNGNLHIGLTKKETYPSKRRDKGKRRERGQSVIRDGYGRVELEGVLRRRLILKEIDYSSGGFSDLSVHHLQLYCT